MVGDRVLSVPKNVFEEASRINSTWGGSIVDMKRMIRYLEIIRDDKLLDNAAKMGDILQKGLAKIAEKTGRISNVRGKGLFVSFDMADKETRAHFLDDCLKKEHLIVLPCGEISVRFRPFLDVKEADILEGLKRIERVLS
jgi:L-lysine 6-transaminase